MPASDCIRALTGVIKGEVKIDEASLAEASRDASLFAVRPQAVVAPKDAEDLKRIVRWVQEHRDECPGLSLTGRAAGTCMSGGPLNDGVIVASTPHLNAFELAADGKTARVEPGVYYRDFEKAAAAKGLLMPIYPASKSLAAFGGMLMNNCGGEKTLRYGQIREWVESLRVVLADGERYELRPLTMDELAAKRAQKNFEGYVYDRTFRLIEANYDAIQAAAPKTTKNSSGYALWRVYDRERGIFDLSQLFVGSQGTLGLLADATVRLMPIHRKRRVVALFFKSWDDLPEAVNRILPFTPETMEAFDDTTLKLGLRFMPEIARKVGEPLWRFALRFWPEAVIGARMLGLPKLILLVELAEDDDALAARKADGVAAAARGMGLVARVLNGDAEAEKYFTVRRESFALLRKAVGDKRTVPFVEDFCVKPAELPKFLPELLGLLDRNGITANIAGHAGDGNFHVIPLMDLRDPKERAKILPVLDEYTRLVVAHGGTVSAEHNDGILRTPYLPQVFGPEIAALFKEVKEIFDPLNIFNPGKKVGGTKEYLEAHIAPRA
jgi:FAD/FMN-containing dehydrogenase